MDALTTGGNLLLIILGFCLLIALHELGHFLAARWAGIRVHVFAIGMGPVVVSYRPGVGVRFGSTDRVARERFDRPVHRMSDAELAQHGIGETEYSLRALPLGGFVGMLGQDDLDPAARSEDPRSYQQAPIGKRMVVISAGVIANLVLAVVLFMIAFLVGVRFEAPVIGQLPSGGPAALAQPIDAPGVAPGLQIGDRVVSIDGTSVLTFADIRIAAAMSRPGAPLNMLVERPGTTAPLQFRVEPRADGRGGLRTVAVMPAVNCTITTEPQDAEAVERELIATGFGASGLGPGWTRTEIDGAPVKLGDELFAAARASNGRPLITRWTSPDASQTVTVEIPVSADLIMPSIDDSGEFASPGEPHLLGLLPLVEITAIEADHPNASVLKPGDVILRAGDLVGPSSRPLVKMIHDRGAGPLPLRILRDGAEVDIDATIAAPEFVGDRPPRLGISLQPALTHPILASPPVSDLPASTLSILPLSRVASINGAPVTDWADMRHALDAALRTNAPRDGSAAGAGAITIPIEIISPTSEHSLRALALHVTPSQVAEVVALGWTPKFPLRLFDSLDETLAAGGNPVRAVAMGFRQTWRLVLLTYLTLDRLVRGTVAVKELHGPVGIVHIGSRVADRGFMYLVFFLAMISVNLAVLNFLPLPIVDGGLFLFLLYEKLRGKPPSIAFQNAATLLGLFLIVGIFLVASYNDVMRLFGRG